MHCSHEIMFRKKLTRTYTYYKFVQHHYTTNTPSRNPQHRFKFINSKYTSPYFLNFTFCIKITNLHVILRSYDPIRQMYKFCQLTKSFDVDKSRPLIIPHEYKQPIEIPILEYKHNNKYNHELNSLMQNISQEFSPNNEELKTIRALELIWPLLQTKNVMRTLAKLLTSSDTICTNFSNRFFDEDNPL